MTFNIATAHEAKLFTLASAAFDYCRARARHVERMRDALVDVVNGGTGTPPEVCVGEEIDDLGVKHSRLSHFPDGTEKWVRNALTFIAMERAEVFLRYAYDHASAEERESMIFGAVTALFADEKEPWFSYDANNPEEKAAADARSQSHERVFTDLKALCVVWAIDGGN